jgi:hypothetical protein
MKDKYKLYLKETEYIEEDSWKVAKRYPSKIELRMDLGSLPEAKSGKARGGIATPMWALILAFPLLAVGYALCFVGVALFMVWKTITTSIVEAGKALGQGLRMFEQWRYDKAEAKKEKDNAKL